MAAEESGILFYFKKVQLKPYLQDVFSQVWLHIWFKGAKLISHLYKDHTKLQPTDKKSVRTIMASITYLFFLINTFPLSHIMI